MTTKTILDRAANLADLQNSGYITFEDRVYSLNESYKDIYELVTKENDDFFLASATLNPATVVILDQTQFTIDLPADFYRLRTASWYDNGTWRDMQRAPLNTRGIYTGYPTYRLRDGKMWCFGIDFNGSTSPSIKIDYYPACADLTAPDSPGILPLSVVPTSMAYTSTGRTVIYTTGTDIRAYSLDDQADYLLYSSAGVKDIGYLNGYVYFVKGGEVWRGASTLKAVMVPAAITATAAAVVNSTIMWGYVYWSTATQCWRANLDGTGPAMQFATVKNYIASYGSAAPSYATISATGELVIGTSPSTGIAVSQIAGDNTYIYYRTTTGQVYRYTPSTAVSDLLASDVAYMGVYGDYRLAIYGADGKIYTLSTYPPVTLTFPQNIAYEIMSYQCAMDFKRKNGADFSMLEKRREELWIRFSSQIHADDAKPERIQNAYANFYGPWR